MLFLLVLAPLLIAIIMHYKRKLQYWERRNFPFVKGTFPFGSLENPISKKKHTGFTLQDIYKLAKSKGWKYCGLYDFLGDAICMPIDLDLVKKILLDYEHFGTRGFFFNEKTDPLSGNLFNIEGEKWRNLKSNLAPAFNSKRMKNMFQVMLDCTKFINLDPSKVVDVKEMVSFFTADVIGSCVLGLTVTEGKDSTFRQYGKSFFPSKFSKTRIVKRVFANHFPNLANMVRMTTLSPGLTQFFVKLVDETIKHREKTNFHSDDFLQQLINLKKGNESLTNEGIASQCFVFLLAGFEGPASATMYLLYALSKHNDIQNKVRDEIRSILKKGDLTYERLNQMKYMDQAIFESQRLYVQSLSLVRMCTKDYKIPGDHSIIEKGTSVFIPSYAIHHDENYYPQPEKFDPERFSHADKIPEYGYLPFGEGPRGCSGRRFALMIEKIIVTYLLAKYSFTVNKKTKEPLEFERYSFQLFPKGGIWLDAHEL